MRNTSNKLLSTKNRIEFFISSFSPLWAIMIITYIIRKPEMTSAIVSMVLAIIIALSISNVVKKFRTLRNSTNYDEMEVIEAKEVTQTYIPYVVSYLFPLLADLTEPSMFFAVLAVIVIIGILYIRTDMILTNPAILLVGFRLYTVKVKDYENELTIISKKPIGRKDNICVKEITHRIYIEQKS